jgi:hypothetical protein
VKSAEEIMNMLEAFDLTGSLVMPASSPGSDITPSPGTSQPERAARAARPVVRPQLIDEFLPRVQWIERSTGKRRADVAHDKLVALGFTGSERTTRRAVAAVKKNYRPGRVRVLGSWTNRFATGA